MTSVSRPRRLYSAPATGRLSMATGRRSRQAIVGVLIIPGSVLRRGLILSVRLLPRGVHVKTTRLMSLLLVRCIGACVGRKGIDTWLTTRAGRPGVGPRGLSGSRPPSGRPWQLSPTHGRCNRGTKGISEKQRSRGRLILTYRMKRYCPAAAPGLVFFHRQSQDQTSLRAVYGSYLPRCRWT